MSVFTPWKKEGIKVLLDDDDDEKRLFPIFGIFVRVGLSLGVVLLLRFVASELAWLFEPECELEMLGIIQRYLF
ncbi:MAG: hypothetical protein WB791_05465 [Waddliaceae bacterium]